MKMRLASLFLAGAQSAALLAGPVPMLGQMPVPVPVTAQFTSRVYFVIHESSPYLVQRGRKVIENEFAQTYEGMPQLQGRPYQVVTDGNQVVFSMVTDADMRDPFQNVVAEIVGQLNGRVRTRGGYDATKTAMDESQDKYLEVVLDDTNTKIRSIVARSITLRDLLAELKLQFGDSPSVNTVGLTPVARLRALRLAASRPAAPRFSYMIGGDCAARPLDWSFGTRPNEVRTVGMAPGPEAKTLDEAMTELAKFYRLKVENHQGTYLFSGECPRQTVARRQPTTLEFMPSRWIQLGETPAAMAPAPRPIEAPQAPMVQVRMVE
jgi:hypothetical protein